MSTLVVENLKGPSTGANANKIIVPSGQTLDASNGLTTPAGHVIQYVPSTFSTFQTRLQTTSTSYVTSGYSLTITPKSATNLILVTYSLSSYNNNSSAYNYAIVNKSTGGGSNLIETESAVGLGAWHEQSSMSSHVAGTTSAITYTIYCRVGAGTGYYGWGSSGGYSSPSQNFNSFHLMEIAQ
tara:strand:- start:1422 stop:1970 length:549 start_codon:yes stop_codon:yes gene_type:complete